MSGQRHIIQKTNWEISISSGKDEYRISNEIRDAFYRFLNNELCHQWDELVPENKHVVIDKIEIDLGRISKKNLIRQLKLKLNIEFSNSIEQHIRPYAKLPVKGASAETLNRNQDVIDALFYFLQQGQLPWWYSIADLSLENEVIEYVAQNDSSEILDRFRTMLSTPVALKRWTHQFSTEFLEKLLVEMRPKASKRIFSIAENVKVAFQKRTVRNLNRTIKYVLTGLFVLDTKVLEAIETQMAMTNNKPHETPVAALLANMPIPIKKQILDRVEWTKEELHLLNQWSTNETKEDATSESAKNNWLSNQEENYINNELKEILDFGQETIQDNQEVRYIKNAGLVIVWPYLNELFKKLEWIEGSQFKSKKLQQKAISMTHYLSTSELESPEYEMTMSKLLCGWKLKKPLKKRIKLTPTQVVIANQLLEAVINNWSALKNTSIEGLQQAFLQRAGKLEKQGEEWKLIMEKHSYDMLLSQIPWGYGMIKLPWNDYIIKVDW